MPYFENQGATLYYEEKGKGASLVFLHGAALDMRQWKGEVDHFSNEYRVITLDARGHGRSSLPPGKVSPSVFWQDVVALLDHLNIQKAILCGLSMGGHVSIQTAIYAQKRVEALILLGAPCTNQFNLFERLVLPINLFSQRIMPMSWIAWSISILGSTPEIKAYIREVVGSIDHDVYNRIWKSVTSMESREGLARITCPTLIMIGDHDWMTKRQQNYINKQIKGSRLVVIKNAHHVTNLDNPQQVQQEITLFLQNNRK